MKNLSESVSKLGDRFGILIKHAYEYKLTHLTEEYLELNVPSVGNSGLKSKYLLKYNKLMKSELIKNINSFENTWVDTLIKLNVQFESIPKDDAKFIEYIDRLLRRILNTLLKETHGLNSMVALEDLEHFEKSIKLEVFKKISNEFIDLIHTIQNILSEPVVSDYISVLGVEIKRIMKNIELPALIIDITKLEESGCDILED